MYVHVTHIEGEGGDAKSKQIRLFSCPWRSVSSLNTYSRLADKRKQKSISTMKQNYLLVSLEQFLVDVKLSCSVASRMYANSEGTEIRRL